MQWMIKGMVSPGHIFAQWLNLNFSPGQLCDVLYVVDMCPHICVYCLFLCIRHAG